jgi:Lactoylglutathione lyase and related lyases
MSRGMLHHLELNVANLEQSVAFWGWLLEYLGYQVYQTWDNGRSWQLGATYLVLVQVEEPFSETSYHRKQVGLNHLAFQVETTDEVDQIAQLLVENNIQMLYQERYPYAGGPKHYAVYFEDPNRIKVEIVATIA